MKLNQLLDEYDACEDSEPLWRGLEDLSIDELKDRWTPLGACLLAVADGQGPRVGAVRWVDRALGTAVLQRAILRWAVLTDADLQWADLRRADLRRADLRRAVLRWADLRWADLTGAILTGAILTGAFLTDAILTDAILTDANLTGADLTGAYRPEGGIPGWEPDEHGRLRRKVS